jgi:predicted esterase YcpF (UPF0227 family)
VHRVAWVLPPVGELSSELRSSVATQAEAAIREAITATNGAVPIVVGKSLGSLVATLVADHGLPAVWFTPLLPINPRLQPYVAAPRQ